MAAAVGENSEDIARNKLVTGIVTSVDWRIAVGDFLKLCKSHLGEVSAAYVGKKGRALWLQETFDAGVQMPEDIAAC
jgi:hypothetical protein